MVLPLRSATHHRGLTRKVNEGEVFTGSITRIIPINAFVEILPRKA